MKKIDYSLLIDKHFPNYHSYRTLRTIFDAYCSEASDVPFEKKLIILENLLTVQSLSYWVEGYREYYISINKESATRCITEMLITYFKNSLEKEKYELVGAIREYLLQTDMNIMLGFFMVYHHYDIVRVLGEDFQFVADSWESKMKDASTLLQKGEG